jgi:hypothetical protein
MMKAVLAEILKGRTHVRASAVVVIQHKVTRGTASLRDAGTTAGIATDKLLALSSDPFSQANQQHLHVHLQPVDLIGPFNQMIAKLNGDSSTNALPSGQDPQVTQTTNSTETTDGFAREEKPVPKES